MVCLCMSLQTKTHHLLFLEERKIKEGERENKWKERSTKEDREGKREEEKKQRRKEG